MIMSSSMFQWIRIGHAFRNVSTLTDEPQVSGPEHARSDPPPPLSVEGSVPFSVPLRSVAGLGTGLPCALCDAVITSTEAEMEVYFLPRPFEPYFFHGTCYVLWLRQVVPNPARVWSSAAA